MRPSAPAASPASTPLREACLELDVRLLACAAGLQAEGIAAAALLPAVQVSGIAAFLATSAGSQIVTL